MTLNKKLELARLNAEAEYYGRKADAWAGLIDGTLCTLSFTGGLLWLASILIQHFAG